MAHRTMEEKIYKWQVILYFSSSGLEFSVWFIQVILLYLVDKCPSLFEKITHLFGIYRWVAGYHKHEALLQENEDLQRVNKTWPCQSGRLWGKHLNTNQSMIAWIRFGKHLNTNRVYDGFDKVSIRGHVFFLCWPKLIFWISCLFAWGRVGQLSSICNEVSHPIRMRRS